VKLDCQHMLVAGLEEDRQHSSSPSNITSQAAIRPAQRRLRDEGFYSGPVDGKIGPQTQRAIRQYQAKHGLTVTGELDESTQKAMGLR
jgi:peptidoglycan hydrolase-like protein with peptidoglycan-binding domain